MEAVHALFKPIDQFVFAFILSLPRIYGFLSTSQLINSTAVPGIARIGSVLSLALIAAPINYDHVEGFDRSLIHLIFNFAKEYGIGFLLGYLVGWIFWVVESAGELIDNQRGASIASSIDPLQGTESSLLGNLFSLVFLTYIFATASVLPLIGLIYQSFAFWPATNPFPVLSNDLPKMLLGLFDMAMRLGFTLAAPIVAIMFLAEFALAMISRFAPQIQVFILAMPIKSMIAIVILIFYASFMFPFADSKLVLVQGLAQQIFTMMKIDGMNSSAPAPSGAPAP